MCMEGMSYFEDSYRECDEHVFIVNTKFVGKDGRIDDPIDRQFQGVFYLEDDCTEQCFDDSNGTRFL